MLNAILSKAKMSEPANQELTIYLAAEGEACECHDAPHTDHPPTVSNASNSPQYGCRSVKNSMRPHKWAMKHCRCYESGSLTDQGGEKRWGSGLSIIGARVASG